MLCAVSLFVWHDFGGSEDGIPVCIAAFWQLNIFSCRCIYDGSMPSSAVTLLVGQKEWHLAYKTYHCTRVSTN